MQGWQRTKPSKFDESFAKECFGLTKPKGGGKQDFSEKICWDKFPDFRLEVTEGRMKKKTQAVTS